ncbi:DUF6115 domain-containing protein [Evansella cellulosilytica]|uniref:Uncharacterized protein n=1 Tax=Evansella cellulosilytica (strain ATCC 21833 / DSM 2522 / FERM P-1141 / JCM 9156 / N-4) TaxID=649639 RepID=E6TST6_EVAC2|nr:hypothetical protein [Evansella cellulosilytica]ADU30728.1 hypothetical protein Bcell_2471 [Evansella cellulosilytica DSM 2522]
MFYLLIISFMLHFVSIYFMIILYQRQSKEQPINNEKVIKEMEDILISYTTEMKEDNERLYQELINKEKTKNTNNVKHIKEVTLKENVINNKKVETSTEDINKTGANDLLNQVLGDENYNDYSPPFPEEDQVEVDTSSTSKILSLHQQGLSINEIAKKLDMGVGEVELLLKFHK